MKKKWCLGGIPSNQKNTYTCKTKKGGHMTKWFSRTEYVDIETGEIIANKDKHKYIKTNKFTKQTTFNHEQDYAERTFTYECIRNRQGKLF